MTAPESLFDRTMLGGRACRTVRSSFQPNGKRAVKHAKLFRLMPLKGVVRRGIVRPFRWSWSEFRVCGRCGMRGVCKWTDCPPPKPRPRFSEYRLINKGRFPVPPAVRNSLCSYAPSASLPPQRIDAPSDATVCSPAETLCRTRDAYALTSASESFVAVVRATRASLSAV
jgi:hypothetical protein